MQPFSRYTQLILFGAATLVYLFGLFINVMDVDAAQYASISREMMDNGSYLEVLHRENNYLDKPPLLFWLSALSFNLFGISNVAYKLPAFLFTLLGVYATYRMGQLLYNRVTGVVASLILYTSQAFFLFNNDVRTDALLTANVAFACWQLLEYSYSKKWTHLLLGFAGVALAMMAKGPIGAVVPAAALFCHFVYSGRLRQLLWWPWYAGIVFSLLLLLPMLYGLYQQYGLAGPEFFFWTQSFGRITGENVWHNDAGPFFFIHNFLWSFLPWTLLALAALFLRLIQLVRQRFQSSAMPETFTLGGFLLPFIALSMSHYKLPHYIFVVYPLCAVFTAGFICNEAERFRRLFGWFRMVQLVISIILIAGAVFLAGYIFPAQGMACWVVTLFGVFLVAWFFFRSGSSLEQLMAPSAMAIITVNFLFSMQVYPALLKYQFGSEMAAIVTQENIPTNQLFFYNSYSHSFEFYTKTIVPPIDDDGLSSIKSSNTECWIIGGEELLQTLKRENLHPIQQFAVNDYAVTLLTTEFLNPDTRSRVVRKMYLCKL